jgi:DNA-binding response OmpR family regulator
MKQSHATRSLATDRPLVLVVDDNDDDLVLFRRAVRQLNYPGRIQYLDSGDKAMAYLADSGDFKDRAQFPSPDFLILDLKMPGTSGFDVLTWLIDHQITLLRTVVLTSSDEPRDVSRASALGAPSFLTKAVDFSEFKETVGALLSSFQASPRDFTDSDVVQVA